MNGQSELWIVKAVAIAVTPFVLVDIWLLLSVELPEHVFWTLVMALFIAVAWLLFYLQRRVIFTLKNITNALMSLKESDYSVRLNMEEQGDAIEAVSGTVNELRDLLHSERTGAAETSALLTKVAQKVDAALFAFNADNMLCMLNQSAEALYLKPRNELLGQTAEQLGLGDCLSLEDGEVIELDHRGKRHAWMVRHTSYRELGAARRLLILSNLTGPLRDKEIGAWRKLVGVLRHEIRNAIAPIHSFSQTIEWILRQEKRPEDWQQSCFEGLEVIQRQTKALDLLLESYKAIGQAPNLNKETCSIKRTIEELNQAIAQYPFDIVANDDVEVEVDKGLLNQVLINLIKNSHEASSDIDEPPQVSWECNSGELFINIIDSGGGFANPDNLFVPFFTTKEQGTGIGLLVSRQIIEAHGGSLTLKNREDACGCIASITLPA